MDLEIGQIVDGYRITGVLGRGGMGVVYKAEDTALSRDVALKVILANLTRDDQFIRRFQTEARTLAQVDSPYIVRVHALRETDAGWFIVMEYVEGGTVANLLEESEQGMDVDDALPIIRQMFQAFDHAHGAGIIHRDIKPENVMLTKSRQVKIADFGLAKQSSPDTLATVTQGMMGTLYYMSPEQVRGLGEVDHRSDLWALGVVMYEMLTGRRPFKATYEAAVLYSILNEEPDPITAVDGDIPEDLQTIIFRLLEKDQDARFQNAGEVLEALDGLGGAPRGA
ncbi:MAG: serine/threonine protein kinase, partial [Rhodothermales bacterium]|nr:serine/threonine protein kinase [Rhodothermales bacterium]